MIEHGELWLRGFVATPDGQQMVRGEIRGALATTRGWAKTLAQQLLAQARNASSPLGACA